jgi:hypothetical protein
MPSHYSVVRYVPDPIADERINVGVIVLGDDGARVRFLNRWERVREFAEGDVKFLKAFARDVQDRQMVLGDVQEAWTVEQLRKYAGEWRNTIQITEPRASLKSPADLMDEISRRFLVDVAAAAPAYRTRTDAVTLAAQVVRAALRERLGNLQARELLKTRYVLAGARASHHFDVVAANGHPQFAAQALSLEVPESRHVERAINASGWSLQDVKHRQHDFPMAILALVPAMGGVDAEREANIERVKGVAAEVDVPLFTDVPLFERWSADRVQHIG